MPKRRFVYSKEQGGVIEVTPEETRQLCDEISADVAERTEPLKFGEPGTGKRRNVSCWPILSDTTGVNPNQIPYAQEKLLRDHGVFTEFCPHTGRAILRDKAHKKAHYRATGTADGDAGYGDAEPLYVTSDMGRARGM